MQVDKQAKQNKILWRPPHPPPPQGWRVDIKSSYTFESRHIRHLNLVIIDIQISKLESTHIINYILFIL